MFLVEILLPLQDNKGNAFASSYFDELRKKMTDVFGGLTAFTRSPAKGHYEVGGKDVQDDIIIFEIMVEKLDRKWWAEYREHLEKKFDQDEIVIRASPIQKL